MEKYIKNINIALIFTVGVFFCSDVAYGFGGKSLRLEIGTSDDTYLRVQKSILIAETRKISDKLFGDFGIPNTEDYSLSYGNVYYFVYNIQNIIGRTLSAADYDFILNMLALEDELADMQKLVVLEGGRRVFSNPRELYIQLNSEIERQAGLWLQRENLQPEVELSYFKIFDQHNPAGLIRNFFHRLYYHLSHSYDNRQHFENIVLMAHELKKGLAEVRTEYAGHFAVRPLSENLYLYGSIRHSLGIGDLDVGIHNPEWSKGTITKKLFDSEAVDLYLWDKEPDETAVHFPSSLLESNNLEFISFVYGIRTIQRIFMDTGISVPIRYIGEIAEKIWVNKEEISTEDLSKQIKVSKNHVESLRVAINSFLIDNRLGGVMPRPDNTFYKKLIGQLDNVQSWRKKFRENKNLKQEAEEWLMGLKRKAFSSVLDSPFFGVNEKNYFKNITASSTLVGPLYGQMLNRKVTINSLRTEL